MPRRMITGVSGSPEYSRMRRSISLRWTPVIAARCSSSSSRACWFFGRSAGQSSMLVPSVFLTSTRPSRSRISPRCASIGSLRTRLLFAWARYLSPESTCSAHRRRNSTAKMVSARKPSTATRSASCGVSRYGSSTRGSPGRKRLRFSAKQAHLVGAVGQLGRREQAPHEPVERPGEEQVPEHLRRQGRDHLVGGHGIAEDEARHERSERVEHRDDEHREGGGVETVVRRRLAVAPDPEAGYGQEERGEAECAQVRDVDEEAGAEAGERAEDRAAEESDREQHHEQHVGTAAERRVAAEDRHLDEHGEEEQDRSLYGTHDLAHRAPMQ